MTYLWIKTALNFQGRYALAYLSMQQLLCSDIKLRHCHEAATFHMQGQVQTNFLKLGTQHKSSIQINVFKGKWTMQGALFLTRQGIEA